MSNTLSIITINKNNTPGLIKTIKSVAAQKFNDFEFIIIDGHSDDNLEDLIRNFKCISKFISEEDHGIYSAFNKGIKLSSGDYILFLNSGDTLLNSKSLNHFLKKIDRKAIVNHCNVWDGKNIYHLPHKNILHHFVNAFIGHSGSAIFKRSIFNEIGLYDESYRLHGDREFYYRIFNKYGEKAFNKVNGYYFSFQRGGGVETNSFRNAHSKEEKRRIEKTWSILFKSNFENWNYTYNIPFYTKIGIALSKLRLIMAHKYQSFIKYCN